MPVRGTDILIVGGGINGLLSAYNLALHGFSICVLDRVALGSEASWAGGGIVSALYPWRYSPAVGCLATWSQGFYPGLAERLYAQTGVDPEVFATGLYWLDLDDEADALAWARKSGRRLIEVSVSQVAAAVPQLGLDFSHAVHMPEVANVRNPRLLRALKTKLQSMSNVCLVEHAVVTAFVRDGVRINGVRTQQGEYLSDRVVLAAGAWSGELLGTLGLKLPVVPIKGQMILYKCAEDFLPAMVLAKGRYAIPRKDGNILIGSTLEHAGFDKTPTDVALASLKTSAQELLPALADAEVVGHWAGLRPGSPEGIPYIGEVAEHPGLWLNCGHYRNGLVLAPASCELLKNLMLGERPIVDPAPYAPAGRLG